VKITRPEKEELRKLREKETREELADYYCVSVSTIRRWVRFYNLQRRRRETPKPLVPRPEKDSGITIIDKARRILGDRLVEKREGYVLDNRPVNTDDILRAARLIK
jgi:hypothetical protein